MYHHGKVSLEHLMLPWYPSRETFRLESIEMDKTCIHMDRSPKSPVADKVFRMTLNHELDVSGEGSTGNVARLR